MRWPFLLIICLLTLLWLSGCATNPSSERTVRITTMEDVSSRCGTKQGCVAISGNSCEVIAPMPKDYLDHHRLEIIGHELWHCFNGKNH